MQNHFEVNKENCPHTHKAFSILESEKSQGDFLSRHYEKCAPCKSKLQSLKDSKKLIKKQIPFSVAPKEIKDIFKSEATEFSSRVQKRVRNQKLKRIEEMSSGLKMFSRDLKTSLLSKQFLACLCLVGCAYAYITFLS